MFMENLVNNDEATLSLILDWTAALQKRVSLIARLIADVYKGGEQARSHVPDFDGRRMHLLFKDIACELLYTVTQNSTSSLGTISLEKLLFQRLKHLL
jgi:hypothetical protein